ncbi:MAG TPA: hypothetical protein VHT24_07290 [Pseudacidobacterium sp.]|nr:hypothetical protein [Pseudacidobacterium sp.]
MPVMVFLALSGRLFPGAAQEVSTLLPDAPGAVQQQTAPSSNTTQQTTNQQTDQKKSQQDQAADELKREEQQRILGVVPKFNVVDSGEAAPLTSKQKFHLFWKSSTDPFIFLTSAFDAGISQAQDNFPGYGQGASGYFKRFGASYADTFDGNLWGNAILPSLLHEDPRYFRKGTGSVTSRILYAAETTVWCRRDDGTWGPNYSNVAGNIIAGGISNVYYPQSDRGAGLTFQRALSVTAEGAIGAQLLEFWPDISRRFFHKRSHPTGVVNGTGAAPDPDPSSNPQH